MPDDGPIDPNKPPDPICQLCRQRHGPGPCPQEGGGDD